MQNRSTTQSGNYAIELTKLDGTHVPDYAVRPVLPVVTDPGSWVSSYAAEGGSEHLNPRHYFTIESSDGGTGTSSGALVRIDLESTIDTYVYLTDNGGAVIAKNDDNGTGSNSALLLQLAPGDYYIVAATYFDAQSGSYTVSIASYLPGYTVADDDS